MDRDTELAIATRLYGPLLRELHEPLDRLVRPLWLERSDPAFVRDRDGAEWVRVGPDNALLALPDDVDLAEFDAAVGDVLERYRFRVTTPLGGGPQGILRYLAEGPLGARLSVWLAPEMTVTVEVPQGCLRETDA